MTISNSLTKLANPFLFSAFADKVLKIVPWAFFSMLALGLFSAFNAPFDYQQGGSVRIMYIHVPSAWMSMLIYSMIAVSSIIYLVWKHKLADIAATASVGIGAAFTLATMITGAIWGKPMWGAWWVWDARLTSVLVLFFIYVGYWYLRKVNTDEEFAAKAGAIYALIGFANLPIIKFSVEWWSTLHQPASVVRMGGPAIDPAMLKPLLILFIAFFLLYIWVLLLNMQTHIFEAKIKRIENNQ